MRRTIKLSVSLCLALLAMAVLLTSTARAGQDDFCLVCAHENIITPLDDTFINPCTGEEVLVTGELHTLYYVTEDNNGGLHVHSHGNIQGGTGVGLTSGDRYVLTNARNLTTNNQFIDPLDTRASTGNFVSYLQATAPGPKNNFYIRIQQHVTINANGELTVLRDEMTTECR